MIHHDPQQNLFRLETEQTSYLFRVTPFGHLEHVYYGAKLPENQSIEPLLVKRTAMIGSSVVYDKSDPLYCLDNLCLEWADTGTGDYRYPPAELKMPDGTFMTDFTFQSHHIVPGNIPMETLPASYGEESDCAALELTLRDKANDVYLSLYYTVYPKTNVIARRAALENRAERPLTIRRLLSMSLDLPNWDFEMITFDGGWAKEAHKHSRPVPYGMAVNSSTTGASSNRHNPGFLLAERGAGEERGKVYGFNLVYSGNHMGFAERSNHDLVRVGIGVNPHCFEWELKTGERFETPEAVCGFSENGLNGLSQNFHDFVNRHVVRGEWKGKERPVVVNNWEATFFDFTRARLLGLARRAQKMGVELFVLDDGWFAGRDNDAKGLGDYTVNRKKLPRGLNEFAGKIHRMGMKFGLWFEPEMVNEDSDLYRAHPEWAVAAPGRTPVQGRNQLVLDLCNPAVRDYIVENMGRVLDGAGADYVKWDMNRHIADLYSPTIANQGEFAHRYILGLYEVLGRVFRPRPHILLESCSSGGNRFDLGMLCYSPQIWASDDTDPIERLDIQGGLSYLYPLSCMGAHVSEAPHQQTLRYAPLSTRFNAAAFGCFGYEMDLKQLSRVERREVAAQVAFYKRHRKTFQYGRFFRGERWKDNKTVWHCVDEKSGEAVCGLFQGRARASEGFDGLRLMGLSPDETYVMETKPQALFLRRFGGLIKHALPIRLNPEGALFGLLNKLVKLDDCVERYQGSGKVLMDGVLLNNQFMGSFYNDKTRLLGDFGSSLYTITKEG